MADLSEMKIVNICKAIIATSTLVLADSSLACTTPYGAFCWGIFSVDKVHLQNDCHLDKNDEKLIHCFHLSLFELAVDMFVL